MFQKISDFDQQGKIRFLYSKVTLSSLCSSISSEVYKVPLGAGAPPSFQPPVTKQPSYDDEDNVPQRPPYVDEDVANQRPPFTEDPPPNDRRPFVEEEIQTTQTQDNVETLPELDARRSPPRSISPENRAAHREQTSTKAPMADDDDSKASTSCHNFIIIYTAFARCI